jgi:hypothetical protein
MYSTGCYEWVFPFWCLRSELASYGGLAHPRALVEANAYKFEGRSQNVKPELALLVDGDQGGAEHVAGHLNNLASNWNVTARICVRNWRSTTDQANWDEAARMHHLDCVQHAQTARGKNASDIELAIRAMDLYHGLGYRAFCILSADSDFLPLMHRLERGGANVILKPLVYPNQGATAAPVAAVTEDSTADVKPVSPAKPAPKSTAFAKVVRKALQECLDAGQHDSGWVDIAKIGQKIPEDRRKESFGFGKSKTLYTVIDSLPGLTVQGEDGKYQVGRSPA